MGNGSESSGDGWRYRGRGYLQLTGRDNYRLYGEKLGLPLESNPDAASERENCWLIAATYMATRRRSGKTLLEWSDGPEPDIVMVTLGINGGQNGITDRKVQVGKAMSALTGRATTAEWQRLLLEAGFDPGPIDGLWGPRTQGAQDQAAQRFGLSGDELLQALRDQ